jgi:hypothetical protein
MHRFITTKKQLSGLSRTDFDHRAAFLALLPALLWLAPAGRVVDIAMAGCEGMRRE